MSVATLSHLTVRYGARTAVDDVSVEIPEGCVGLLGPNGAGKTTLLKALLGFLRPTSGSAELLGLDVARAPLEVRRRIGLMPEVDCHIPGVNAVSFVAYAAELAGMPASTALGRAHEVLEYCGLGEARYRNVETYSTGMKQRIKLAQALVHGPKLLFLDEPTNGLDPAGRDEMLALVADISRAKGVNVVVCSHLLPDVERVCGSVMVMRGGRLVEQGTLASLRATAGSQVDVELREPSEAFLAEAGRLGAVVVKSAGATARLRFPGELHAVGALLFAAARSTGAQVRGFRPAVRSLEDIFLEVMQ